MFCLLLSVCVYVCCLLIGEIKIIKKHVFGETTDSSGLLCTVTVGEWIVDFSLVCQI